MSLEQLITILQLSIGPVIVFSGVGLILLSMTNRYGRVIDRSRALAEVLRNVAGNESHRFHRQLKILMRRVRLLRLAITLATISILLAALLVIALFVTALLGLHGVSVIITLFVTCMATLIGSLIAFIIDINVSLRALKLELDLNNI